MKGLGPGEAYSDVQHHTIGVEVLGSNSALSNPQVQALFGLGAQEARPAACPVLVLLQQMDWLSHLPSPADCRYGWELCRPWIPLDSSTGAFIKDLDRGGLSSDCSQLVWKQGQETHLRE